MCDMGSRVASAIQQIHFEQMPNGTKRRMCDGMGLDGSVGDRKPDPFNSPIGATNPSPPTTPPPASRGGLQKDRLLGLGIRQKPLQTGVFLREVVQSLRLVHPKAAVLLLPWE